VEIFWRGMRIAMIAREIWAKKGKEHKKRQKSYILS
jgi:hypothetical protein